MLFDELAHYFEKLENLSKRLDKTDVLAEMFSKMEEEELRETTFLIQGVLAPAFVGLEFNISTKILIRSLAETINDPDVMDDENHRINKVTELFNEAGDLGIVARNLISEGKGNLSIVQMFSTLNNLAKLEGDGSVDAKIKDLSGLLVNSSNLGAKYIIRFILGKLRMGIGVSTILDGLGLGVGIEGKLQNDIKCCQEDVLQLKVNLKELKIELKNSVDNIIEIKGNIENTKADIARLQGEIKNHKQELKNSKKDLESAYNTCPDIGFIASTLYTGKMEAIRAINPHLGTPLKVALCERLATAEEIIEKLGECSVEVKYDGLRLQVHKAGDKIDIFSRNLERISKMFPEIANLVREKITFTDCIVEGELIAYDKTTGQLLPFQTTMQRKRKHNIEEKIKEVPLRFFVFDLLYADGVDYTGIEYEARRTKLDQSILDHPDIKLSESEIIDNSEKLLEFFDYTMQESYEGIIAKRLDSPYVAGARNFNWIKFKKSYSSTLTDSIDICVVGYDFGRGSRARFGLGAILGAVYDNGEERFKTVTKVGTGFTEEDLKTLKIKLDEIKTQNNQPPVNCDSLIKPDVWVEPKYVMKVRSDEITRSNLHTCGTKIENVSDLISTEKVQGYALRFPRAEELIRSDKNATDATTVEEVVKMFDCQSG